MAFSQLCTAIFIGNRAPKNAAFLMWNEAHSSLACAHCVRQHLTQGLVEQGAEAFSCLCATFFIGNSFFIGNCAPQKAAFLM